MVFSTILGDLPGRSPSAPNVEVKKFLTGAPK